MKKPKQSRSNYAGAAPGLCFHDEHVVQFIGSLEPSPRGVIITGINKGIPNACTTPAVFRLGMFEFSSTFGTQLRD